MTNSIINTADATITPVAGENQNVSPSAPAASNPSSGAEIVFNVKRGDIVEVTVAAVKKQPEHGVLVVIEGNPMAYLSRDMVAGRNKAEKASRQAQLQANPGTKIKVQVVSDPTVEMVSRTVRGQIVQVPQGRIRVSEQHAVMAAQAAQEDERKAAVESIVASLVAGSVVKGAVRPATKASDRNPGEKYTYGAFVEVGSVGDVVVSGLLHVKEVDGGDRGLAAILAAGTVEVEIVEAKMEGGQPRIQLSQKAIGEKAKAAEMFKRLPVGAKVKGKVVKTGEQVGSLHGRVIELESGHRLFLCDDDACVKSESSLAKGNSTRVQVTGEIVGGMLRVTRRGV